MPPRPDPTISAGGNALALRQRNTSNVLETVRSSAVPLRVAEVASLTGLSRPTVETVLDGLVQQNWLRVADTAETQKVGRPAKFFEFNGAAGYVVGIDVGAHTMSVALGDLYAQVISVRRMSVDPLLSAEARLAQIVALVRQLLDENGVSDSRVFATTVGTPGTVIPTTERVGLSPGMPGWGGLDVRGELASAFGSTVVELENDANLAAIGERAQGVAAGKADVVFLLLGERLGAGIIANDALVRGRDGAAGELGYVPVLPTRERDPRYGPLEFEVNGSAFVLMGEAAARLAPESALARLAPITAEGISRAATDGDEAAISVVETYTERLAGGIAPTLLTLNPEMLVIGGGISRAGEVLRTALVASLRRVLLYMPDVQLSKLDGDAVLVGAVTHALGRVEVDVLAHVLA